jgi:cytochrome bd-type quinol oxidase subunit 2
VSTFPDGIAFLLLVVLLGAAVWFDQRRQPASDRAASVRAGLTIAAAAGVIFGVAGALLGTLRFTNPSFVLSAFGFLTALGMSVVCGALLTLAWSKWRRARAGLGRVGNEFAARG